MLQSLFLLTCLLSHFALASSHSEAPSTAVAAGADITDFYMFRSYGPEAGDAVTFIINSSPLQSPFAGPNYYGFSPTHFYQLHISSSCADQHVFSFYFGSSLGGADGQITEYDYNGCTHDYDQVPVFGVPTGIEIDVLNFDGSVNTSTAIPLKAIGNYTQGQTDVTGQNYFEVMHVDYSTTMRGDRDVLASNLRVPYPNVGDKTFPGDSYNAYLAENDGFVQQINLGAFCVGQTANVFAGQRADSFSVNLGRIFDLLNFNPIPGFASSVVDSDVNNMLRDKNVQTIAIEIPRTCLTGLDANHVVTAWATVSELYHNASDAHLVGAQFSRLGNPLVNEVAIGLPDKQLFSISPPTGDGAFLQYVNYPSLPAIINAVYLPFVQQHVSASLTNIAPTNLPRLDLQLIFLFGFPNLNRPGTGGGCEAMRLNVEVPPVELAQQENMGVLALDIAGYPNGRRPGDDVVDISLRAMMGVVCSKCDVFGPPLGIDACVELSCGPENAPVGSVEFLDGAPQNAAQFMDVFPYLNPPYSGATANKVRGGSSSSAAAEMDSIF